MAMSKETKKAVEEEVKLDMTPMIDVVFLLLIFFMVTMKFRTLEGKLESRLPKDMGQNAGGAPVDREKVRVRIKMVRKLCKPKKMGIMVTQYKNFHAVFGDNYQIQDTTFVMDFIVGEAPVLRMHQKTIVSGKQPITTIKWTVNGQPRADASVLEQRLKQARKQFAKLPVILDPDRPATYAALITALHAVTAAGFTEIQFAGKIGP